MAKKIWIASIACDKFKIDNWNILHDWNYLFSTYINDSYHA